jgi:hypothetical protein
MLRIRRARRVAVIVATLAATIVTFALPARAVDPATITNAIDYLASTQISGTTVANGNCAWDSSPTFPFYTYDAVLAIAEHGQTGPTWSTTEALDAVDGFENVDGDDPLAFMDLMADNIAGPGDAAKTVVLLAGPLGLPFDAYNPGGDAGTVDLVAAIGSPAPDGSYAPDFAFNDTLYAALATKLISGAVVPATVDYVKAGQKVDGSWSYDHDAGTTTDADIDTTGLSLMVLLASGLGPDDDAVHLGLRYLAEQLQPAGYWNFFGEASVESSSRAMLAIAAAGFDVNSSCWRDTVAPKLAGAPFVGADAAIEAFANDNGSIAAPMAFNVTYSTSQAVEGLERSWLPITVDAPRTCVVPTPDVPTPDVPTTPVVVDAATTAVPVLVTPAFTG